MSINEGVARVLDGAIAERDALKAEVARLRQALGEYGEHDAGCPKRYLQDQFCASMKTEGKCECGLDEELGLATAVPTAPVGGQEER